MAILLIVSFSLLQEGRLPLHPSLPCVHLYPLSILTPCPSFPRVQPYHFVLLRNSHSQKRGSRGRGRETPLTSHSLQPGASARAAVQHSVLPSHLVLSAQGSTFSQGDEVAWEICYPLRTHEWSMLDRGYAEEGSHFRCQTPDLFTGSDA